MTDTLVLVPGPDHPITVEPTAARVIVRLGGRVVADSQDALTLTEASYPPVQYVPLADVDESLLVPSSHTSYCPYKGAAAYFDLRIGDDTAPAAVWTYRDPYDAVAQVKEHVAFFPDRVDAIEVHRER